MSKSRAERVPELDGLRGVAILAVVIFHCLYFAMAFRVPLLFETPLASWYRDLILSGWLGVDLFFVLSGFLITGILLDTKKRSHYFRNFFMRRVLRIFPLYYLFLVLLPLLAKLPMLAPPDANYHWWLWTYTANWLMAFKGWDAVPMAVQHVWSLAIEEQFYLLWPFLIFFLDRRKLLWACIGILVAAPLLRWLLVWQGYTHMAYLITPARLDSLGWGALLAIILRDGSRLYLRNLRICGFVGLGVLLALFINREGLHGEDPWMNVLGLSAAAASFAMLLSWLSEVSWLRRCGQLRLLRFFGKYSYAIYIAHQPVIISFIYLGWLASITPTFVANSTWLSLLLYTVMPLVAALAVALVTWYLWESHFLKLKKRFGH